MYETIVQVGWTDLDVNGHMANSAYLSKAVEVRMRFFHDQGLPIADLGRLRVGPVAKTETIHYYREVSLFDALRGTLELDGQSEDGSRFALRNEFLLADGRRSARIDSTLGWLDLDARRLVPPPPPVAAVIARLTRTAEFATLPSSVRPAR